MHYKFILPNDSFKSLRETFSFHRGMTYTVSHVFNDNGKLRVFVKDKFNKDIEISDYNFEPTAKTVTASEERKKRARLDFYWENNNTPMVLNKGVHFNDETSEFFDLESKAVFCSKGFEDVIGSIRRETRVLDPEDGRYRHFTVEGSKVYFKSKQEYYDYFKKIDMEKFVMRELFYFTQEPIDFLQFLIKVPHYDKAVLNEPDSLEQHEINFYVQCNKMDFKQFLTLVAQVIFDEDYLSDDNKKIVYNIIEAYELLPNSYGPTSVAKLIMGKEKKKNQFVEHLSGTCTTLKQPQAYTLADIVESFMYNNGIFVTKEEYSSGTEWRGHFEYIGSKMINTEELTKLKNELK